jgi:hypothetical protein
MAAAAASSKTGISRVSKTQKPKPVMLLPSESKKNPLDRFQPKISEDIKEMISKVVHSRGKQLSDYEMELILQGRPGIRGQQTRLSQKEYSIILQYLRTVSETEGGDIRRISSGEKVYMTVAENVPLEVAKSKRGMLRLEIHGEEAVRNYCKYDEYGDEDIDSGNIKIIQKDFIQNTRDTELGFRVNLKKENSFKIG